MTTYERIQLEAKDTVGYKEAENKDSFMIGVSVGSSKSEKYYEGQIKQLSATCENYKRIVDEIQKDITTLACLIRKYSHY